MRLKYEIVDDQEILLSEDNKHQVMMGWERPYMYACIDKLKPYGDVLEIGFGLGYSASKIQEYDINSHTIVECSPTVWEKFYEWEKDKKNIILAKGRWQDILETLGKFDCIFFDDYIEEDNFVRDMTRFNKFLHEILKNHSKIGTKICSYSTENYIRYEKSDILKIECEEYPIEIPKNCKYAKGTKMYIPIFTKIKEYNDEFKNSSEMVKLKPIKNLSKPKYIFRYHVLYTEFLTKSNIKSVNKVSNFCRMMKNRGHHIIFYGSTEVEYNEAVIVNNWSDKTIEELTKRVQKDDLIITFENKPLEIKGGNHIIQIVRKCEDILSNYRIFESYAMYHYSMGLHRNSTPTWQNAVIPNTFEIENESISEEPGDYFLYFGRITKSKGVNIAVKICETIKQKLIIAGPKDIFLDFGCKLSEDYIKYIGYVEDKDKKSLFEKAKGIFLFSDYIEASSDIIMEAMAVGCPAIVADHGSFAENVIHGVTGFKCQTLHEMCWAAQNISKINRNNCKKWISVNYNQDRVAQLYEDFFTKIQYRSTHVTDLNLFYKQYPIHINPENFEKVNS